MKSKRILSLENWFLRAHSFLRKHFQSAYWNCQGFFPNSVSLKICRYLKRDNPGNDCSGRVNPDRRTLRDVTICADPQESHASLLFSILFPSVADPGCLTRILIFTHPGSQIPDHGSRIQKQQQKRRVKKYLSYLFFSHKVHKIENYFIFEMRKKKFWPIFKEL